MDAPPPDRRVWPVWTVPGPALAALIAAFVTVMTLTPGWFGRARLDFHLSTPATIAAAGGCLVAALLTAPAGVFLGPRHPAAVSVPAIVLMLIGLPLDALAPDGGVLIGGRIVTGLGAGAVIATAVALSFRTGPARRAVSASVVAPTALFLLIGLGIGGYTGRPVLLALTPILLLALVAVIVTAVVLLVTRDRPAPSPYGPRYGPPYGPGPR